MNNPLTGKQMRVPSAAGALLFIALLAQAPHAATVFIRIAPQDVQWEVWWLAVLGGVVYAIALESATAYFVWRNKMTWAIWFALFSIMHNVAYYMPGAWTFNIAGAELSLRYIVSALLISASLPIAIAAFSHVHVEEGKEDKSHATPATTAPAKVRRYFWQFWRNPAATPQEAPQRTRTVKPTNDTTAAPIATPSESGGHSEAAAQTGTAAEAEQAQDLPTHDARTQALQLRDEGYTAAEIARMTGAKYSTVQSWLRRATVQTNGVHQ